MIYNNDKHAYQLRTDYWMVYRSSYKIYLNVSSATNRRMVADICSSLRLLTDFM